MGNRSEQKADPAQETAIRKGAGPCAVIAGPGSGKTFVLVERIRCLIEERGVDPSSILVLTFSRAAAAHMRRRFLLSCPHPETVFGTFHSVFFRILQASSATGLRLIDPAAKQDYLRHLCSLPLPFLPEKTTAEELQLVISRYKNGLPCRQSWAPSLVEIYDAYLEGRGWLDFDDMILRCVRLLQAKPDLLAAWRERFRWILVDEFQDVSPAQYRALQLLAAPSDNLFVVGDDDQSIYGFRGTDPLIMQRFLSDYVTGAQAIVKEEEGLTIQDVLLRLPMLPEETKAKLAFISDLAARENLRTMPLRDLVILLWDNIAREYFNAENDTILADVLNTMEKYPTLAELQEDISNLQKQYAYMARLIKNKSSEYLKIMSIHSSKALEFNTVFLVGAAEGILPDLSHENVDLDEEANLAYVAATRAKEDLYISYASHNSKSKDAIAPSRYFAKFFSKK
jgi:superfamily I DNA/RNA helicase